MKAIGWILAVAAVLALGACKNFLGPAAGDDPEGWITLQSGHFVFHYPADSFAAQHIATIAQVAESHRARVLATLQIEYCGVIAVVLRDSRSGSGTTPCESFAYPYTETVDVVCNPACGGAQRSALTHELSHVICQNALGEPGTFLLYEGLAEALEEIPAWRGMAYHEWVRRYIQQAALPSLSTLADNFRWQKTADDVSYPAAGSFVLYALERFGADCVKGLFTGATPGNFPSAFNATCGRRLDEVESEWRDFCLNSY